MKATNEEMRIINDASVVDNLPEDVMGMMSGSGSGSGSGSEGPTTESIVLRQSAAQISDYDGNYVFHGNCAVKANVTKTTDGATTHYSVDNIECYFSIPQTTHTVQEKDEQGVVHDVDYVVTGNNNTKTVLGFMDVFNTINTTLECYEIDPLSHATKVNKELEITVRITKVTELELILSFFSFK